MESMKLKEYLELKQVKPYKWAQEHGLNQSRVYEWINRGATPTLDYIIKIKKITNGAVGLEDWDKEAA